MVVVNEISFCFNYSLHKLFNAQKDPTAFVRSTERIILDKELKKIVENSKVTVAEFSPMTIAEKYLDIFKRLKIPNRQQIILIIRIPVL